MEENHGERWTSRWRMREKAFFLTNSRTRPYHTFLNLWLYSALTFHGGLWSIVYIFSIIYKKAPAFGKSGKCLTVVKGLSRITRDWKHFQICGLVYTKTADSTTEMNPPGNLFFLEWKCPAEKGIKSLFSDFMPVVIHAFSLEKIPASFSFAVRKLRI